MRHYSFNEEIEFMGHAVIATGTYYPSDAGDRDTPPEPSTVEVEEVFLGGIDVTEMMDELHSVSFDNGRPNSASSVLELIAELVAEKLEL